jgi:hypothetical protein
MEHGNGGIASHPLLLKTRGAAVWPQEVVRTCFRCVLLVALVSCWAYRWVQFWPKTQGVPVSTRFPYAIA